MDFDKDGTGAMSHISAMAGRDTKDGNKVHLLVFNIANTFKLAPNVCIVESYKSVGGGIFES
jgi:hypothetical protein